MNKLLVILGSTSTGKTNLALSLAKKFNGELISADSRQVYIGLDIGTGKLPDGSWNKDDGRWKKEEGFWQIDGVKIWMYDILDPKKQYTVFNFIKDSEKIINRIRAEEKLPIIVGGTGLYIRGLLEGFPNLGIQVDLKLRNQLERLSLEELQKKLQQLSFKKWNLMNRSDRNNSRRLIRAIEIAKTKKLSVPSRKVPFASRGDVLKIGLIAPRKILYQRINERVIFRIDQGMIKEAETLHKKGLSLKRMRQLGLEYGVLANYLEKKITKEELNKILQGKIHSYARRQITWFKKEKNINWFDITEKKLLSKVENLISKWYDQTNAA